LQKFAKNNGLAEDYGPSAFSTKQVERIAVLDIKILNMDRNTGNILTYRKEGELRLIPIDHGLCIPDMFNIAEFDICWMSWI
jgi:hypothetical protein